MLAQVAHQVAAIDPQEGAVAELGDRRSQAVDEARRGPVAEDEAGGAEPARQVDVLEPGGIEAGVEAADALERRAAEGEGGGGRLRDGGASRRLGGERPRQRQEERLERRLPGPRQAAQLPRPLRLARRAGEVGRQAGGVGEGGEAGDERLEGAGLGHRVRIEQQEERRPRRGEAGVGAAGEAEVAAGRDQPRAADRELAARAVVDHH